MKKLFLSLITILAVGFLINSCSFPELPSPEITVSQDFMKNVAVVHFITDTSPEASGALVESLDGTVVTITGPDAAKVYNIEGRKEFKITGGILALLLDPSADFSGNKEYNVNVVVEPVGYLKRTIPVKFIKDQNDSSYEVAMLKKTGMPAGITMQSNTSGTISASGLTSTINLTASNAATSGVTTAITVPTGIKMKDASGAVLTGPLKAEVISFSENGDNTAYFPGGLSPENIDMGNGTTASGAFVSAGFASIDMTVGGKKVKSFEGAKVAVKMTLSKDNYNPKTDKPFAADDTIEVWSYDNDKGQWKLESLGTVKKDTDNSLYVSFETSHLSYFNLDYLFTGDQGYCTNWYNTIKFNWTSSISSINARVVFTSFATSSWGRWGQFFSSFNSTITKGQVFPIYNGPRAATRVDVYDNSTGKLLLSQDFARGTLCANPTVTLNVPAPPSPTLVSLKYVNMCPGKKTQPLPPVGTRILFKEAGSTAGFRDFHWVTSSNKSATTLTTNLLTVGKTYDFKVVVGSQSAIRTFKIASANYTIDVPLPKTICDKF
jgi:hypothetical protein